MPIPPLNRGFFAAICYLAPISPTRFTVWLLVAGAALGLGSLLVPILPPVPPWLLPYLPAALHHAGQGLLASYAYAGQWLALGFDLFILALFLTDAVAVKWLTRGQRLRVRRERPARLSLGVDNDVTLVVDNHAGQRLRLMVRDEAPSLFRVAPQVLEASIPSHGWARLAYRLLPTERGNFSFGDVGLRIRGPLGLAASIAFCPAAEAVQVYPNLLEMRRYEALVRTTLVRAGGYRAKRLPGAGREFSHYRDYTPDDDFRHVSWKATARRNKPITTVFESEHSQDIIFCLDIGRMMAARVGTLTKLDHAINAVLMLTHVSQTFQDNLGLLVFSHTVHLYLPPAKGRAQHATFLASALQRQTGVVLCQLSRGVQLPDRPASQTRADDGIHRFAR